MPDENDSGLEVVVCKTTESKLNDNIGLIEDSNGNQLYVHKHFEDVGQSPYSVFVEGLILYNVEANLQKGQNCQGYGGDCLSKANNTGSIYVRVDKAELSDKESFGVPLGDTGLIKRIFEDINSMDGDKDPEPFLVKGMIVEGLDKKNRLYVQGNDDYWFVNPFCNIVEPFTLARTIQNEMEESYKRLK